jgi:hypothetical protein
MNTHKIQSVHLWSIKLIKATRETNNGTCREKKLSGIDVRPTASSVLSLEVSNAILL